MNDKSKIAELVTPMAPDQMHQDNPFSANALYYGNMDGCPLGFYVIALALLAVAKELWRLHNEGIAGISRV